MLFLHSRKGEERLHGAHRDRNAGWRRRAARPTSFLSCHRTSMWGPPVGGTFWFQIFIQAPSLEIWRKTISGAEGGLARKWGGLFSATSLEKIIGGVIAIISFRSTVTAKPR